MSPLPTNVPSTDLNSLIESAIQALSQRLSIEPSQIELLEAKEVVWSNSSLGCPKPGMYYADVLTPGYLIRLSVNQVEFEYHAGRSGGLIYCQDPQPPVSGAPGDI